MPQAYAKIFSFSLDQLNAELQLNRLKFSLDQWQALLMAQRGFLTADVSVPEGVHLCPFPFGLATRGLSTAEHLWEWSTRDFNALMRDDGEDAVFRPLHLVSCTRDKGVVFTFR